MVADRWPKRRVFHAGVLMGKGYTAEEIAAHPEIRSHAAIRRYAKTMGHAFSDEPHGNLILNLPRDSLAALRTEAGQRRRTAEALGAVALSLLAEDTTLLANVLDGAI